MSVPVREFVRELVALGLMTADDLRAFLKSHGLAKSSLTASELAQALAAANVLTAYQAECLAAGKANRLVLGRYLILEPIGAGGMGEVFRAVHRRMDREVALKVISAKGAASRENLGRFRREVKLAARLHHPHIVTAYDADEHQGTQYLVMEYVPGRSLADVVRERGPFSVEETVDILAQVAQGLGYAHAQGLVHRDVKPSNLLIDGRGFVKILDLGLARGTVQLESAGPESREGLTYSGQVVGTCHYMAPEQASNARLADGRADIYSLGCTWHYLLTGRPPFAAESLWGALIAHREHPVPSLRTLRPDAPPTLDRLFRQMLAKEPSDRPQSMSEVLNDLEAWRQAAGSTVASPPATLAKSAGPAMAETRASLPPFPAEKRRSSVSRRQARSHRPAFRVAVAGVVFLALATLVVAAFLEVSRRSRASHSPEREPATPSEGIASGDPRLRAATASVQEDRGHSLAGEPVSPQRRGPRAATPGEEATWTNLLEMIDPPQSHAIQGDWRFENGNLCVSAGAAQRLEFPYVPAGGYQLQAVFTYTGMGEVNVILPVADRYTRVWVADRAQTMVGGLDVAPSSIRPTIAASSTPIGDGRPHELLLTIVPAVGEIAIDAALDGKTFLAWQGPPDQLSLNKAWELSGDDRLGIGSQAAATFSAVRVRLLEGPPRPVAELAGHQDVVAAVAFSPDAGLLATAGYDGVIIVWSLQTHEAVHTLRGHQRRVLAVAFSPDGRTIASGGSDNTVRLWDVANGRERKTLGSHAKAVVSVAFHPTEPLLVSGGDDQAMLLWKLDAAPVSPQAMGRHTDSVRAVLFSPRGDHLASASWDASVTLDEFPSQGQPRRFTAGTEKFEAAAFSPQGNLLAAATPGGEVLRWSVAEGVEQSPRIHVATGINALAFAPRSEVLAAGGDDGTIRLWNPRTGAPLGQWQGSAAPIYGLAFSSAGALASGGEDETVCLWDITAFAPTP